MFLQESIRKKAEMEKDNLYNQNHRYHPYQLQHHECLSQRHQQLQHRHHHSAMPNNFMNHGGAGQCQLVVQRRRFSTRYDGQQQLSQHGGGVMGTTESGLGDVTRKAFESQFLVNRETFLRELPQGYRFLPTDEELLVDYLKKKINNMPLPIDVIHEVDLYKYSPEELTGMYKLHTSEDVWYFFTERERKYPKGNRPSRSIGTKSGHWKPTGADSIIYDKDKNIVGYKKTLDYMREGGVKTNWKMHEYRMEEKNDPPRKIGTAYPMKLDGFVLCRLYTSHRKKNNDKEGNAEENQNGACGAIAEKNGWDAGENTSGAHVVSSIEEAGAPQTYIHNYHHINTAFQAYNHNAGALENFPGHAFACQAYDDMVMSEPNYATQLEASADYAQADAFLSPEELQLLQKFFQDCAPDDQKRQEN